jgi:hypothetical protein
MNWFMARCLLPALLIVFVLCILIGIACVAAAVLSANGVILWN